MLVETIYRELKYNGVKHFVFETDIVEQLSFKNEIIHTVADVRSAAFYACGLSQKNNSHVALFVRKEFLPSSLTGLTEAWFQRCHLVIVALGSNILNDDLSYFKNCTCSRVKIQTEEDIRFYIPQVKNRVVPEIFLVEENLELPQRLNFVDKIDVDSDFTMINQVFVYERVKECFYDSNRIVIIEECDKYCTISKYMGYCVGTDTINVLVIDDLLIFLDVNIFNNRYLNGKFKLLVIGSVKDAAVLKWIAANRIKFIEADDVHQALEKLLNTDGAAVALVNLGEER